MAKLSPFPSPPEGLSTRLPLNGFSSLFVCAKVSQTNILVCSVSYGHTCLRTYSPPTSPHPDTVVRDYLLRALSGKKWMGVQSLTQIFSILVLHLCASSSVNFFAANARVPYKSSVKQFYKIFKSTSCRNDFYKRVVANIDPPEPLIAEAYFVI